MGGPLAWEHGREPDALVEMLIRITDCSYGGAYRQVPETGDYVRAPATALAGC